MNFINWGNCYYKLEQVLETGVGVTNYGKVYLKLGQILQIRAVITNWSITRFLHEEHTSGYSVPLKEVNTVCKPIMESKSLRIRAIKILKKINNLYMRNMGRTFTLYRRRQKTQMAKNVCKTTAGRKILSRSRSIEFTSRTYES